MSLSFTRRATKFTVSLAGKPVNKLCPGSNHAVKLEFPFPRYALLTSTHGTFAEGDPWDW